MQLVTTKGSNNTVDPFTSAKLGTLPAKAKLIYGQTAELFTPALTTLSAFTFSSLEVCLVSQLWPPQHLQQETSMLLKIVGALVEY